MIKINEIRHNKVSSIEKVYLTSKKCTQFESHRTSNRHRKSREDVVPDTVHRFMEAKAENGGTTSRSITTFEPGESSAFWRVDCRFSFAAALFEPLSGGGHVNPAVPRSRGELEHREARDHSNYAAPCKTDSRGPTRAHSEPRRIQLLSRHVYNVAFIHSCEHVFSLVFTHDASGKRQIFGLLNDRPFMHKEVDFKNLSVKMK